MVNQYQVQDSRFQDLDIDTSQLGTTANIENLNETVNQLSQEQKPANNIIVLAKRDNITHNYFHYFELYWDARDCLSSIIIRMPKTDVDNTKYWINYTGDIVLYMGDKTPDEQITTDQNNKMSTTSYWDLQGQKPIFQGEVTRVKEMKNELEIHVDSIGVRFKQKIPEEFRQTYINGQNVRDAFQAICEFLGVKYICPPPQEKTETTTDGTENNVNQMQQTAQQITDSVAQAQQQADSQATEQQNTDTSDQTSDTNNSNVITDNPEVVAILNGYTDVCFDANGAIVHNSQVLETGIDITDTLLNLEEHPLDKYLPEEEYEEGQSYLNDEKSFVVRDIHKLLNGVFFDTVHNNVMNYGAITVEPASTTTSDMSSTPVAGDVNGDGVVNDQDVIEGTGTLTKSQLWTALAGVMHDYYPKATADYWIPQLRDAPSTWSGVATVVNKIGGDKGTQDNVIRKVLGYKQRCKSTSGVDRHHSDGRVTTGYKTDMKQRQTYHNLYNTGKKTYNKLTPEQKEALRKSIGL